MPKSPTAPTNSKASSPRWASRGRSSPGTRWAGTRSRAGRLGTRRCPRAHPFRRRRRPAGESGAPPGPAAAEPGRALPADRRFAHRWLQAELSRGCSSATCGSAQPRPVSRPCATLAALARRPWRNAKAWPDRVTRSHRRCASSSAPSIRPSPAARRCMRSSRARSTTPSPGAPHNVYYEAAEPYNAIVDAFLAKVLAPAGVR